MLPLREHLSLDPVALCEMPPSIRPDADDLTRCLTRLNWRGREFLKYSEMRGLPDRLDFQKMKSFLLQRCVWQPPGQSLLPCSIPAEHQAVQVARSCRSVPQLCNPNR